MSNFAFNLKPAVLFSSLLTSAMLISCATAPQFAKSSSSENSAPAREAVVSQADTASSNAAQVPKAQPQLIKTAQLTLTVKSIEESIRVASTASKNQQGDVLGLQDQTPQSQYARRYANLQIRVPQDKLEPLLDELAKLGTIQSRSIAAEDVSTQLVDFQARLRNLRRTEENLLKIMERSGSVGDVLKVSQEISRTREAIEQITAQLKNLQNRVAYSTITLRLEQAVSTTPAQQPLGLEFQETWERATHSVSSFTIGFLKLGLWLIAYTPYLLVLVVGGIFIARQRRRPLPSAAAANIRDSSNQSSEE